MNNVETKKRERSIADRFFYVIGEATKDRKGADRDSLTRFCNRNGLYWRKYTALRNPEGKEYEKYTAIDPAAILYAYIDYGANPTYIVTGEGDMFISGKEADDAH